ncbi:alginate lyase family protein [Devosia sp. ZB163]|uniref:heparinase II/III family protein n=1 Tax=Devosia sp. ZB163 TaxID=3025938 RepID=UPI002360B698|nr:alginate lyase family protein [Devosia sp. ZB163]MDC9826311.1 alginate lyase family protein [Devosia sp. ZB163]
MSLGWYVNRLRAMSAGELAHRVGEKVRKNWARGRLEGWARYPGADIRPLPGLRERALKASADIRDEVGQAAELVLSGRLAALGVAWPQRAAIELFPAELWRLDPVTNGLWPGADQYCFDIAYRHERQLGDIKYVWELNRLQFLQPLAAHALLTSDAASLAAIETAVASWHAANPPFRGLGWNSGIELALRAISLLIVVSLVGDRLSSDCRSQIGSILHATAVWLTRYPSRFSSANNHLIAELAGEFLIGLAMPDLLFAAGMAARARSGLTEEAGRQILADGVPAEQSPTYGAFSAEFLLLCSVVARDAGQPFPDSTSERLDAFAEFIAWMSLADGTVPAVGDDDEGRVVTLGSFEAAYPGSVANAIGAHTGRGACGLAGDDFRSLLLGSAIQQSPARLGQRVFAAGGYSVVNEEIGGRAVNLLFDHAPLGYLSIAAHGHADALAITLAVDGKPVLVDPGTYLYHSGGVWRDWFRGTAAHNTLSVSGADQSIISGAFNWSHKASSRLEQHEPGERWRLVGSHDGYRKRFGVIHQRSLVRTDDGFTITDRLLGSDRGLPAQLTFQLAPDLRAHVEGQTALVQCDGAAIVSLAFDEGELSVQRGGELGGGWVSPQFGLKVEADRITWNGAVGEVGRQVAIRL